MTHSARLLAAGLLAGLLTACAGPVADRAFDDIASQTESRIGQRPRWIKSDSDETVVRQLLDRLLTQPLGPDDAVQVALLNNRRLQADYAELGIAAADLTSAWRPGNPGFGLARLTRGTETETDRSVGIDALGLLLLPIRAGIEEHRFARTKLGTANAALATAAQTRRAWYEAVAAEQTAGYIAQVRETAALQTELMRRRRQAGSAGLLDLAREQLFLAESTARLARSRLQAAQAREKLARLMGLWGGDLGFTLPPHLPELPTTPRAADRIEATAIAERLDVQMAKADLDALRKSYGLTAATRFINVLELGYQRNRETGKPTQSGYEIRLEVPLFDFGDAKATKAENLYRQALERLADTAVRARSAARESWLGYRTAYDIARHYQGEVLPLRRQIGEEMLLRYNGMQVSVFDLLADARDQIADVTAALEAQRDFWLADTDLTFVTLAAIETGS
jgi:hypothetical protein